MSSRFLKCFFLSSLILTQATAYGAPPPPPPPFPDQFADEGKSGEKQSLQGATEAQPEVQHEAQQNLDDSQEDKVRWERMIAWLNDKSTQNAGPPESSDISEDPEDGPIVQSTQERGRTEAEPSDMSEGPEDGQDGWYSLTPQEKMAQLREENEWYHSHVKELH